MGKLIAFGPVDPSISSQDIAVMYDRAAAAATPRSIPRFQPRFSEQVALPAQPPLRG